MNGRKLHSAVGPKFPLEESRLCEKHFSNIHSTTFVFFLCLMSFEYWVSASRLLPNQLVRPWTGSVRAWEAPVTQYAKAPVLLNTCYGIVLW